MSIQLELQHWHMLTAFIGAYAFMALLIARLFFRNQPEHEAVEDKAIFSFWVGLVWPGTVLLLVIYWFFCVPVYYLITIGNTPRTKEQPKKE